MGNQNVEQGSGQQKSARVGQPGEKDRTSQENAGSTEGGGTRNADAAKTPRKPQRNDGQVAKEDGISRDDIEAGNDGPDQRQ
jgi:hypothetical protein